MSKTKNKKPESTQVFRDGVAKEAIQQIVENLPNIMFITALLIRAGIGYILWMHSVELLAFIKNEKARYFLTTVFVIPVEILFTSFSLASAKLRKDAYEILTSSSGDTKGKTLLGWANTFFIVTLLGSFVFNAMMLYWTQQAGSTGYFNAVQNGWQLNIFIQVMNAIAVFASEGSAFILNSNSSTPQATSQPQASNFTYYVSNSEASEIANRIKSTSLN